MCACAGAHVLMYRGKGGVRWENEPLLRPASLNSYHVQLALDHEQIKATGPAPPAATPPTPLPPHAGPVVLVVDCPSAAFVPALVASPQLNKWATEEAAREKGEGGWGARMYVGQLGNSRRLKMERLDRSYVGRTICLAKCIHTRARTHPSQLPAWSTSLRWRSLASLPTVPGCPASRQLPSTSSWRSRGGAAPRCPCFESQPSSIQSWRR